MEPSGFTLLSNNALEIAHHNMFWSPLDSHYSQTLSRIKVKLLRFWSPLDSHYSQTMIIMAILLNCFGALWIHTTLKQLFCTLHNQIRFGALWIHTTLKRYSSLITHTIVLEPSGFTLLSNNSYYLILKQRVLEPSGFTLLSNLKPQIRHIWIYLRNSTTILPYKSRKLLYPKLFI